MHKEKHIKGHCKKVVLGVELESIKKPRTIEPAHSEQEYLKKSRQKNS